MKQFLCSLLAFTLAFSGAPAFAGPLAASAKAPARGYVAPKALFRMSSGRSAALALPRSPSLALGLPVSLSPASPSGAARALAPSAARVSAAVSAQVAEPSAASAASRVAAIRVQVHQALESLPSRRGSESDRALGEDLQRRLSGECPRFGSALERAVDGASGEDAGAPKAREGRDTFRFMNITSVHRTSGDEILIEGMLNKSYSALVRSDGKAFLATIKLWNAPAEAERSVKPEELDGLDAALKRFVEQGNPSKEMMDLAWAVRHRITEFQYPYVRVMVEIRVPKGVDAREYVEKILAPQLKKDYGFEWDATYSPVYMEESGTYIIRGLVPKNQEDALLQEAGLLGPAYGFDDEVPEPVAKPEQAPAKQAPGGAKKPVRPDMGDAAKLFYALAAVVGGIGEIGLAAELGFAAFMAGLGVLSAVALAIAAFTEYDKASSMPQVPQGDGALILVALPILSLITLGGTFLFASPLASIGALLGGLNLLNAYLLYRWFWRASRHEGPVHRLPSMMAGMVALLSVLALFGPAAPGFVIFQALAALVLYASARK